MTAEKNAQETRRTLVGRFVEIRPKAGIKRRCGSWVYLKVHYVTAQMLLPGIPAISCYMNAAGITYDIHKRSSSDQLLSQKSEWAEGVKIASRTNRWT